MVTVVLTIINLLCFGGGHGTFSAEVRYTQN